MKLERFPGINIIVEEKRVVFELKIKNQKSVYMCHPFKNNTGGIAFVDSIKFLELWRNSKIDVDKEISNKTEDGWRDDYKYSWAEEGFKQGLGNPVPLARVCCYSDEYYVPIKARCIPFFKKKYVKETKYACSFSDGITRTIWLLSNGVKSFPVHLNSSDETKILAKFAGITENSYYIKTEIQSELNLWDKK